MCRKTTIERRSDDAVALRHWSVDLLTWHRDGRIVLRPYNSVTSKVRVGAAFRDRSAVWCGYKSKRNRLYVIRRHRDGGARPRGWLFDYVWFRLNHLGAVTLYPDGTTDAPPRRPASHKAFCRCSACYLRSKYGSGWRHPLREDEQAYLMLGGSEVEQP